MEKQKIGREEDGECERVPWNNGKME